MAHGGNNLFEELTNLNLSGSSEHLNRDEEIPEIGRSNVQSRGESTTEFPITLIFTELRRLQASLTETTKQLAEEREERLKLSRSVENKKPVEDSHLKLEPSVRPKFPFERLENKTILQNERIEMDNPNAARVKFSLPSDVDRYATSELRFPVSTFPTSTSGRTTSVYTSPLMSSSFVNSGNQPPPRTINTSADNSTPRLDAVEQQLAMITKSVTMLTKLMVRAFKPKAVPPRKFNAAKNHNLRTFFRQFERYCEVTYPDQPEDWITILGNFLEGSYMDLYDQIIKEDMSYFAIKDSLLQWWDYEVGVKKDKASQEFMLANRRPGETINMFALRLEQLANRAYPGVCMRTHDNLRRAFLYNLPTAVEQRVHDYILNYEGSTGQKMQFDQLVRLANQHCNELASEQPEIVQEEPEVITIAHVKPQTHRSNVWGEVVKRYARPKVTDRAVAEPASHTSHTPKSLSVIKKSDQGRRSKGRRSRRRSNSSSSSSEDRYCKYCGKDNHNIDDCFLLNNICPYCRQEGHSYDQCPKRLRKQEKRQLSNPQLSRVRCPFCSEEHLGKDCPNGSHSQCFRREAPLPQRNRRHGQDVNVCDSCGELHKAGACGIDQNRPLN